MSWPSVEGGVMGKKKERRHQKKDEDITNWVDSLGGHAERMRELSESLPVADDDGDPYLNIVADAQILTWPEMIKRYGFWTALAMFPNKADRHGPEAF